MSDNGLKYSFIIPYYNRPQLCNTLVSYEHFYSRRTDFEIIILEDKKNKRSPQLQNELMRILDRFTYDLRIVWLPMNYDNFSCPCSTINHGVDVARGQYVILTNPECFHKVDVLSGFDFEFGKHNRNIYIVCGCVSVENYPENIHTFESFKYRERQWYQHTQYAPRDLNFCTAMAKKDFINMWGFNEEFDKGVGRADVEFVSRIKRGLDIIRRDDLLVLYQDHSSSFPEARKNELVNNNYSCTVFKSRFKAGGGKNANEHMGRK